MPGRNGTGPMGAGPMTGRGFGYCPGVGYACRRGFRSGFGAYQTSPKTQKEVLIEEKSLIEERLSRIESQLKTL